MFCGNCGRKLDDNVKFCPSCGFSVDPAVNGSSQSPAPQSSDVQPEGGAASDLQAVTPAGEAAHAPVSPAVGEERQAAAPSDGNALRSSEAVAAAAAAEPTQPAAPIAADDPAAAPPVLPREAAPHQPVQADAFAQQTPPEPPAPAAPAVPTAPTVPKKRSKAGLIAGLTAGAVVLGGGAAGYFLFHDDITHLFMGDAGYAKMIDKAASGELASAESSAEKYLPELSSSIGGALSAAGTTNGSYTGDEAYLDVMKNTFGGGSNGISGAFDNIPEGKCITEETGLNVKLGSVFAMLDSEETRQVIDFINKTRITSSVSNGETDHLSIGIDCDGVTGSADLFTKDGDIVVTFPGISDKKIFISKDEIDEALDSEGEQKKEIPELDTDEVKRIKDEISEIYYTAYDSAEITFTDNTEWTRSADWGGNDVTAVTVKGNKVRVYFTYEQLKAMADQMCDLLKNDEYLIKYVNDAYDVSEADYKKLFEKKDDDKNGEDEEVKFGLAVEHIVDVHNNVLASQYDILSEDDTFSVSCSIIGSEKSSQYMHINVYDGKKSRNYDMIAADERYNDTDGRALLQVTSDKGNDEDIDIAILCEYTDRAAKTFLGNEIQTGKYVIKPKDPDTMFKSAEKLLEIAQSEYGGGSEYDLGSIVAETMMEESEDPITGLFKDNKAIIEELMKAELTYECVSDSDSELNVSFGLSLGDIGSIGYTSKAKVTDKTETMPEKSETVSVEDKGAVSELENDLLTWAKGLAEKLDGGDGEISGFISEELEKAEKEKRFKVHYSDYYSYSDYRAVSCASDIYYTISSELRDKLAQSSETKSGVIKLYFNDGKCEVIDDGGIEGIQYDGADYRSVYAEVFYDTRISDEAVGVTAVYTDSKTDLPSDLPDIYNYIDRVYPWEDEQNYIGDYVVGTCPELLKGEVTTTELPADKNSPEVLNTFAEYIADSVTDLLGRSGDISKYRSGSYSSNIVVFMHGSPDYWYDLTGLAGGRTVVNGGLTEEFTDELKSRLDSITEEHPDMSGLQAGIYFLNGKFAGVTVMPAGHYIAYNDSNSPSAAEVAEGVFGNWADANGDGSPVKGFIYDNTGKITAVGTYSASTGSPVTYGTPSSAAASAGTVTSEYDGTWTVTAVNGESIEELYKIYDAAGMDRPEMYIAIEGGKMRAHYGDLSEEAVVDLEFGKEYEGYPAAFIIENGEEIGRVVFYGTTALLTDDSGSVEIEIEWEGREIPASDLASIAASEGGLDLGAPDISDIAGKWVGEYNGKEKVFTISTNYVIADAGRTWVDNDDFSILESPTDNGFIVYDENYDIAGRVTYDARNDTVTLYGDTDEKQLAASRLESAPSYAFTGSWTVETLGGMTVEEYSNEYGTEIDETAINLSIGEYTGLMELAGEYEVLTVLNVSGNRFDLAFDSSYFFDCTYDSASGRLTAILRYDGTDETEEYVFVRGSAARG